MLLRIVFQAFSRASYTHWLLNLQVYFARRVINITLVAPPVQESYVYCCYIMLMFGEGNRLRGLKEAVQVHVAGTRQCQDAPGLRTAHRINSASDITPSAYSPMLATSWA